MLICDALLWTLLQVPKGIFILSTKKWKYINQMVLKIIVMAKWIYNIIGPVREKTCLWSLLFFLESIISKRATCRWKFNFLASLCSWEDWFESRFEGNPEDRFCRKKAYYLLLFYKLNPLWFSCLWIKIYLFFHDMLCDLFVFLWWCVADFRKPPCKLNNDALQKLKKTLHAT